MLQLKNITKVYKAGDTDVTALSEVSVSFRESEFVAILGQSGSGKTTLLNIIGGLDHYTSGQLTINGIPTSMFKDGDWDTYRNHSVGFVFQNYNLIPHQSVLANVELALTLSGVSRAERRKRAAEALGEVGLSDQMFKRPNQLSGGQMQRVAIARAIVNEPDILLADEPTGALDSETSIQIMEIIKKISKDRLVIMVTHNPELAVKYATRIVKLKDGKITDDSMPYEEEQPELTTTDLKAARKTIKNESRRGVKKGKKSMSAFTAFSLSLNNLRTKSGRTFLTSFAGSIGIIGIALIMALSNGIQLYINKVQEDTLSTYPISIESETADFSNLVSSFANNDEEDPDAEKKEPHDLDKIYESRMLYNLMNNMLSIETSKNNLKSLKNYLDEQLNPDTSTTDLYKFATVKYIYDTQINVLTKDPDGKIIKSDYSALLETMMNSMGMSKSFISTYSNYSYSRDIWTELLAGDDGALVNGLLKEQYDVIEGRWPEKFNEVILVVNSRNEISDIALYALGLKTADELTEVINQYMEGEKNNDEQKSWSYSEVLGKEYKLVLTPEFYLAGNGEYQMLSDTELGMSALYTAGTDIKIVGIVRKNPDATAGMLNGTIGYTSALTKYIIDETAKNPLVTAQINDRTVDALTNLPFKDDTVVELTAAEKAAAMKEILATYTEEQRAEIYIELMSVPSDEFIQAQIQQYTGAMTRENIEEMILKQYPNYESVIKGMDDETLMKLVTGAIEQQIRERYAVQIKESMSKIPAAQLSVMLDKGKFTDEQYAGLYDATQPKQYSDSTYEDNMKLFGYLTVDDPSSIKIYASTFADKDKIADVITKYNETVSEDDQIEYTDYVKLLMSSITTIIDVISYVLIAFVAISLVVSSIMIGIITYISVLERTKEIGILRSVGASKKDVARVFNAETFIVGFLSGIIGIGFSLVLCIPINAIIRHLSGINNIGAQLPIIGGVALVLISILLTFIAGLVPSSLAAKKDPVTALRTE